ncbi:hypothetical protein C8J43_10981 [Sphingomonas sp. PP-CE-1G-424]|nr:hypothetical protein C8J43_10981 [Sphingomonas sp. PP-CE-1G-424]
MHAHQYQARPFGVALGSKNHIQPAAMLIGVYIPAIDAAGFETTRDNQRMVAFHPCLLAPHATFVSSVWASYNPKGAVMRSL